jgi:hypothetical protein
VYVALGKGSMGLLKNYHHILQAHNNRLPFKLRTGLLKTAMDIKSGSFFIRSIDF